MAQSIDFYFDFSSPYGYLASERIEAIAAAHDRTVHWCPVLLGAIFKISGQAPLTEAPLKGDYSIHDFKRSAREHAISYRHPDPFPIASVAAARAALWIRDHPEKNIADHCAAFIHSVFRAFYAEGHDITDPELIKTIAEHVGIDPAAVGDALQDQAVKDALKTEVSRAIENGVFGSPMMIVDGEPFWGHDRLEQLERWLAGGGW